jgi:hypothetical protein
MIITTKVVIIILVYTRNRMQNPHIKLIQFLTNLITEAQNPEDVIESQLHHS